MLETVDLKKSVEKEEYKEEIEKLKQKLAALQRTIKEKKIPVIVLFEGWGGAGKGTLLSKLILTLDPRDFKVHSIVAPDKNEKRKPFLWRHWTKIPLYGKMTLLDRSWYQDVSVSRLESGIDKYTAYRRMDSIKTFERQLTDDGYVIVKFFLHISQKEQKRRFDKLESSSDTKWRVTPLDRMHNKQYNYYFKVFDEMLEYTNMEYAPWHIVSATDHRNAMLEIYRTLCTAIEDAIAKKQEPSPLSDKLISNPAILLPMPKLSEIDLSKKANPDKYKEILKDEQKKLSALHNKLYRERIPVIIVYEGWDAAGKGGNIKRIAAALDPRGYEVSPVAAPDKYEINHHYLWRFWRDLPKTGHISIFDRSWYGRVMVERIEGFCTQAQWQRAYQEINEFERELYDWGAIIVKFWLHITPEEQLVRFTL